MNKTLAEIFDHMADLYLLRGKEEDRYRIASYRRIAQTLRYFHQDLEVLDRHGKLQEIPGVGPAIAEKIHEFLEHGKIQAYEKLRGEFPKDLLELLQVPSLGPKKVQMLWRELGVVDRKSLQAVLMDGSAEALPGFGKKSVENIQKGLELGSTLSERKLLAEMIPLAAKLTTYLKQCKALLQVEPAGSFRRGEETIGDLDLLVSSKNPASVIEHFIHGPGCRQILAQGRSKASMILDSGHQVDLRVVHPDEFGAALQYFTGSKDHNVQLRSLARDQGLTINEYGVFRLTKKGVKGPKIAGKTEWEVYESLGLQYIPPEMRTATGEIPAAKLKKKLPGLISAKDLRGDLHDHTLYSDGINSIEEMATAAENLGLEYIALTDHSPSLKVAHGLEKARVERKSKEIDLVQKRLKIKIFKGTEVDILADGSLDYPDSVLKTFDIVVASVHTGMTRDNTKRILKALENPHVTILGHISGRMFGRREAYPIDYDAIFKKAAKTGTWIEINAQPSRQDISWDHIRRAKELGVKFVISTDSHSRDTLWYLELGAIIARRGWLTKDDVMNTLPLKAFQNALKA